MRKAAFVCIIFIISAPAWGQSENVPATHPVYTFLKRMEVKGLIEQYHDAILPLSRREVAGFLTTIKSNDSTLTEAEKGWLHDYLSEFQYDISASTEGFHSLLSSSEPTTGAALGQIFSHREKFLYAYTDSSVSFFVNGLLDVDARRIAGDALGDAHAEFMQFGGRFRGTILGHLGYYLQGTNAQFWGSRELLGRDPLISQSHALTVTDAQNFDFGEGYFRYDSKIVSVQVGRERVLWGIGYDQKMTLSDNVRVFDFIRADAQYKSLKYTFLHAWLTGTTGTLTFSLPSDTSAHFVEPIAADKYFAAHRLELSFPRLFDIGAQEMVIYSNRSPDLAYLNPITVIESAQRSRGERDNVLWAFDIRTHFLRNMELSATILFDDIHFAQMFSSAWYNRYAWQAGMFYADAFSIPNTSLMVEYTRVEPWVFAHNRSRDDSYTSLGAILGPRIGPNADAWFIRYDFLPLRNLFFSARVSFERKGENVVDDQGHLLRNVGGDVLQPHRDSDPETKKFLDGILLRTRRIQLLGTYEFINQMWFDVNFEFESIENTSLDTWDDNNTLELRLRMEL